MGCCKFNANVKNHISLTDNQIVLYWINNPQLQLQLKQWVRNRVIEISHLTEKENWYCVESIVLGTRKVVKRSDILGDSTWC